MLRARFFAALCLLLPFATGALPGCSASSDEEAEPSEDELVASLSATSIRTERAYQAFSIEGGGFGQAGRSMKFLIDHRSASPAKRIQFVNGNFKQGGKVPEFAKFHYLFAQKTLGITETNSQFNDETYFRDDKKFFAGTIQTYQLGDAQEPTYAVQFYPDDVIHEEGIVEALRTIKAAFAIPNRKMMFVATGPQQTTARVAGDLRALGFEISSVEQLLGSVKYLPLNPGEAWGFLRIFPRDVNDLRPTDIPVFDELPLDLSVVSGSITRVFQDVTSHVNLKAKERGTPNMVLRDAATNAELAALKDKPVHLVVKKTGFVLEPTTEQIVADKLRARLNKPLVKLQVTSVGSLVEYDAMCPTLSPACVSQGAKYGGKAAGLGFLANKSVLGRKDDHGSLSAKLGYDITPQGFAIPVVRYKDFLAAPENAGISTKIQALIARESTGNLSPNERATAVKEIQELFYKGKIPATQLSEVKGRLSTLRAHLPGLKKIKVRSSANAEDIPNFDGAGLHDSFSAALDEVDNPDLSCALDPELENGVVTKLKMKPKTVQCAIKGVYASLWNQRAVEERSFARIDHATAAMGLAVVPAYDTESDVDANGVVITRVINSDDIIGYTVSQQKGDNLVTNPDPGTISQMTVATFGGENRPTRYTVVRFATPKASKPPLTTPVLTDAQNDQIVEIARTVEIAYCKTKPSYYDGDCRFVWLDNQKPRSLDMEFKLLENGQFVLKQVREFHGQ